MTSGVILTLNDWLNNGGCFSVPFYDLPSMSSIGMVLVTKCKASYS